MQRRIFVMDFAVAALTLLTLALLPAPTSAQRAKPRLDPRPATSALGCVTGRRPTADRPAAHRPQSPAIRVALRDARIRDTHLSERNFSWSRDR